VSDRMWSVNLDTSNSEEYQTVGGHSGRSSESLQSLMDWYRSTLGVIVISLGTPRSAGENFGCT
jgi:hypothetical protein